MAFCHGSDVVIMPASQYKCPSSFHSRIPLCLLPSFLNFGNSLQIAHTCTAARIISSCTLPFHTQSLELISARNRLDGCCYSESLTNAPFTSFRQKRYSSFYREHRATDLGYFRRGVQQRSWARANARFDPGGGNGGNDGAGRVVWNLALAGGLTYLTITGKLGWVFDAFVSLWLLGILLPIVGVVAFLWFADRETITGNCPNCGNEFQVFKFTVKDESQLCPYCSQPFRIDGEQFVRDLPHFSSQKSFKEAFRGFGQWNNSSSKKPESPGIIVDVEAEVLDKDEVGR
ncbi:hypothetical protein O6H91_23G071700 [Diphasiastrum complanatum]|uniref:Uncharacterized protein n=9 Tax=Diphasiastrum complanatum TaxID=34168 RepID=A0ACC2ACA3_DIPCM|nr:hypothetical protein O6H91_23G071700 [Diphasiastrum complanatum]KAJ7515110.1 hypothetical protein O6H91_23G071700 [Diphasiastrum complanatum]KAJ7515111.1 hypothetical protein O6H91_23G071700 [Diphasiastrum complanatum]KAJ7515112.1 hypothetical protein O6H91_23G071700 [Diphasiastrum complanatum]KAJ7515113.1 hypothetical protein O6H91_23G071700 [Diphasiastrum complanatum]